MKNLEVITYSMVKNPRVTVFIEQEEEEEEEEE